MGKGSEYKIPFTGLKPGHHEFRFQIETAFFESYEYSEIEQANCLVTMDMEKQSTMLVLHFEVSGNITVPCDRCSDELEVDLEGNYRLIVKFSDDDAIDTDEIIYLTSSEHQIDVEDFIYQFIHLSAPAKRVHPQGKCNEEMMEALEEYLVTEKPEDSVEEDSKSDKEDPRWAALKKLKEN